MPVQASGEKSRSITFSLSEPNCQDDVISPTTAGCGCFARQIYKQFRYIANEVRNFFSFLSRVGRNGGCGHQKSGRSSSARRQSDRRCRRCQCKALCREACPRSEVRQYPLTPASRTEGVLTVRHFRRLCPEMPECLR